MAGQMRYPANPMIPSKIRVSIRLPRFFEDTSASNVAAEINWKGLS